MMKFNKVLIFAAVLMLGSQLSFGIAAYAAAPVTINNDGSTGVTFLIGTAATGTTFLTFFDSGTTTASPTDLLNVTYNSTHPTAGLINSSSSVRFTFPLSVGTNKSGGTFDILANTYRKGDSTPNSLINIANGSINDSAHPILTAVSISSDGNDPAYAKVGDTVTVTFTGTEPMDDGDSFSIFTLFSGGDSTTNAYSITNTSGNTWELSYLTDVADTQGAVTFELNPADLIGNQGITSTTDVTDASSVTFDMTAPIISEVTPVTALSTNTTPNYIFTTNEAGTITYSGDCSSATSSATSGSNTITFDALAVGTHNNCTIIVTDGASNISNTLAVTPFRIISSIPSVEAIGAGGITTNLNDIPLPTVPSVTPTVTPTPTPNNCAPLLSTFLRKGDKNDAVSKLQTFLKTQNLFNYPVITGFFGSITEAAVKGFQNKYASEILAPQQLTTPTGLVMGYTLAKINIINCKK